MVRPGICLAISVGTEVAAVSSDSYGFTAASARGRWPGQGVNATLGLSMGAVKGGADLRYCSNSKDSDPIFLMWPWSCGIIYLKMMLQLH